MIPAFDNTVDKSFIFVGLSTIVSISYFQETNRSIASKNQSFSDSCWYVVLLVVMMNGIP